MKVGFFFDIEDMSNMPAPVTKDFRRCTSKDFDETEFERETWDFYRKHRMEFLYCIDFDN